jgi:hypothetical protein
VPSSSVWTARAMCEVGGKDGGRPRCGKSGMDFEGSSWSRSRPAALYWCISSEFKLRGLVDAAGSEDCSPAWSEARGLNSPVKS